MFRIASHKDGPVLTAIENVQKSLQKCLNAGQSMQGAKPLCEGLTCVLYNVCLHYKLARKVVKVELDLFVTVIDKDGSVGRYLGMESI